MLIVDVVRSPDVGRDDDDFPGNVLPAGDMATPAKPNVLSTSSLPTASATPPQKPTTPQSIGSRTPDVSVPETPQINREPPRPQLQNVFLPQPEDDIFATPFAPRPVEPPTDNRRYPDRVRNKPKHLDDYAQYSHDVCCMSMAHSVSVPET